MMWQDKIRGFYAVIDEVDPALATQLLQVSKVLQVRVKGDADKRAQVARWAREITRQHDALLVVNDELELALEVEADAVHLGQDDMSLSEAKGRAGGALLIGISTHNPEQVLAAVQGGADYLGYGPVFETTTKENPDPIQGPAALRRAVVLAGPTPVVAIGGVTPVRARLCFEAGAWAACAISSVNRAEDATKAATEIAAAFGC